MNVGVWHNGNTNLPVKKLDDGYRIPDASLKELHEDRKQTIQDQVEFGVLAEEYGYRRVSFSEHHFVGTGAEFSPNPLQTQTAIAAQTDSIKLRQMANIITWHDPLRLAEQTATLDIISDGRQETGIGRGYQSRENETLGQYWGGTVQDQEKNRASFEEKFEILMEAWTEDYVDYSGEFHEVPPTYTKFHHPYERAYYADDACEHDVADFIDWKEADNIDDTNWVLNGPSTLSGMPVYPQPLQEPHPPLWQAVSSQRSIKFAAQNGINAYIPGSSASISLIKNLLDSYRSAAEKAGWPDRRPEYEGEPFDAGWDDERGRGVQLLQPVHITDISDEETIERWLEGSVGYQQYISYFGLVSVLADDDEDPFELIKNMTGETLIEKGAVVVGTAEEVIEYFSSFIEDLGVDDFGFDVKFDAMGFSGDEMREQMEVFSTDVLPYLRDEFP